MGSKAKRKTTMAKLSRENRLRARRAEKQAKKDSRRRAAADRAAAPDDASAGDAPADRAD